MLDASYLEQEVFEMLEKIVVGGGGCGENGIGSGYNGIFCNNKRNVFVLDPAVQLVRQVFSFAEPTVQLCSSCTGSNY